MTFTPQPRPEPPTSGGLRQFLADFTGVLFSTSKTVRPDAIALDPRVSYSLGPVAEGDDSDGPIAWAWRARVADNGQVLLARETDTRDAWGTETVLFTISGVLPTEIDLTFEQQGRAVVCAERPTGTLGAPEVWLYYFNPLLPGFVFENFGSGRTPRLILDNPQRPSESDVLFLYINPTSAQLELRQQRDRYLTVYPGPALTDLVELTLEETLWTVDNRLRVVLARRDTVTGTYMLELLDSTLYPFVLPPEDGVRPAAPVALNTSELRRTLLSYGPLPFGQPNISEDGIFLQEGARPLHPVVTGGTLAGNDIIINGTSTPARLPPEDGARPLHPAVLNTSTFGTPLIVITGTSTPARLPPEDAMRPSAPIALASSTLQNTLIVITGTGNPRLPPEDAFRPAAPAVLTTSTLA